MASIFTWVLLCIRRSWCLLDIVTLMEAYGFYIFVLINPEVPIKVSKHLTSYPHVPAVSIYGDTEKTWFAYFRMYSLLVIKKNATSVQSPCFVQDKSLFSSVSNQQVPPDHEAFPFAFQASPWWSKEKNGGRNREAVPSGFWPALSLAIGG